MIVPLGLRNDFNNNSENNDKNDNNDDDENDVNSIIYNNNDLKMIYWTKLKRKKLLYAENDENFD